MMEKIEWYQEVLELEPSSKVFFPLAKLLQNNNQPNEAIATLQQGLDRHPEFFEARLMLIDLLESNGRSEDALQEVGRLGSKFDLYPGFWQAWAGVCEQQGQHNVSVALRLLAAFLSGREVTLLDILQHGLHSILGEPAAPSAPSLTIARTAVEPAAEPQSLYLGDADKSEEQKISVEETAAVAELEDFSIADAEDLSDSDEEPFSLRTKTMAAVLVEQGDLQGALEIYEELLASADTDEKKQELQGRIDELKAKMKTGETEPVQNEEKPDEPLQGKQKLLDALENLAKRLEVRAGD